MLQEDVAEVNRKIQERMAKRKGALLEEDCFFMRFQSIGLYAYYGMQYS